MKRIKIVGLCLVAVFAFTAVAAASASAEPTYKTCVKAAKNAEKKYTGGYNDKACSEVNSAGEGKYAAEEVVTPLKWEGKSKTTVVYFTKAGKLVYKLVCKKDKVVSTIEGPTTSVGALTLESCETINEANVKTKCPAAIEFELSGLLVETLPAERPGDELIVSLGGNKDECGSFKIKKLFGYRGGSVEGGSKGSTVTLTANPSTFEQENNGFRFEGEEAEGFMTAELEGVAGSVEASIATIEPIGPKKPLVVVIP